MSEPPPLEAPPPEPARRAQAPHPEPAPFARPAPSSPWRDGPWERVRRFTMDPRVGAVFLVLLAVAAGVAWYRTDTAGDAGIARSPATKTSRSSAAADPAGATGASGSSRPPSPGTKAAQATQTSESAVPAGDAGATGPSGSSRPASPGTQSGSRASGGSAGTKGKVVVVHVAGAVVHPGVVQLRAGSRVIDALEAVGGGVFGADLDRLNLAAVLVDGERVAVPKIGEQPPAEIPSGGGVAGGPAAAPTVDAPLDLNSATLAQLDELPGIGPSLAAAIVAERTKRGGFGSVNDLRSVRGIGDGRFADLAPLVHVG
ncbi:MAG: comEA [Actinomycetia bacterium]|nr:comEA [Actinomycetes bacterium]